MFTLRYALLRTSLCSVKPRQLVEIRDIRGLGNDCKSFNQPLGGNELPRCAGIASMMRLPVQTTTEGLDACFVGVPLDSGTSFRTGTRMGPRQIRSESAFIRPFNPTTGAAPFESLQIADIGDAAFTIYNLPEAVKQIREAYRQIIKNGCIPLTLGGDHTLSYPILQAMKEKYGPLCLIHIDAHSDTSDMMYGEKIAHGTPFRRAIEEGCLDCQRSVQIGLRGTGYSVDDYKWVADQGVRLVLGEDCWNKSLVPLMKEVSTKAGDRPVYISFDIDGLDPSVAPGTGTPEIAGLSIIQGLEIIRGCKGLNIKGVDLVEVSPTFDPSGNTALVAANLMFELLCVLPGVKYYTK
ncbi:guanidinobutyrase [Biomphalaria glabrata]|uniref:Agmatinase, mitochondrial n=1 Tax=Biomphalaria glabrata TaxID=6526 RepID=A0A2C9K401_BIOGL|nr:guanidinobutyrase [Biomphalaria glabrata]